ncbi:Cytosolic fe-s cluster assembly factor narfl [Thalictrum thalictroides]|uniref:Cytosolic fe-s cluster assembly factor narfl n=1 Tax=Thalictrum thalictroides TaxID=46969 RepID=A0A7J6XC47_THATH|nr:Cytosolic fe-s cluster assembly factor narfl [Thalictrum thalictroides]
MSNKFSPALRVSDLNDFIAPSQGCIVSLKGLKAKSTKQEKVEKLEKVVPTVNLEPAKIKSAQQDRVEKLGKLASTVSSEPVKVNLKDCLACSGCITSAETVMLEKQSLDEFLLNIESGKAVFISLSPQSRAALAAHFGLSPLQVFRKLTTLFKSLGVKAIFDTSCSRDISLIESCNEFVARYKQHLSANAESSLPMLASSCPGWICYAEKKLESYVLPYISSVKSPQQTIGAIFKHHLCQKMDLKLNDVYHVTIMPCYDKKLEAARDDFVFSMSSQRENAKEVADLSFSEVDSVLTTGEVLDLIRLKSVDFKALEESPLDKMLTNVNEDGHLFGVSGSSGGYAETIFRHAAKTIFGRPIEGPLNFRTMRNSDFREVILEVEGKTVLKFALCYGFRNLQGIVRKIKDGKCDYHFLEVMACPSGCLNGGGQIKPKEGQSAKALLQSVERVYMEDVLVADPFENPLVKSLYDEWLERPGSEISKKHTHTEYHPMVKSVASELLNW